MQLKEYKKFFCGKRKCAPSSARTNFYNIKRIRKLNHLDGDIPTRSRWVTSAVVSRIKKAKLKTVAQRNLYTALVSYLKATGNKGKVVEQTTKLMNSSAKKMDDFYKSQERTPRQVENWIDIGDLQKFVKEKKREAVARRVFSQKEWSYNQRKLAQETLILTFHGSGAPPRLEFATLYYVSTPTFPDAKRNYLFQKKSKWFALIRDSKVSRSKGDVKIQFEPQVARLLNQFKKFLRNNEPVFKNKAGRVLGKISYAKMLRSLMKERFGKKIGATLIRNIYLSSKYQNLPSIKDQEKEANDMMHSAGAKKYYIKKIKT